MTTISNGIRVDAIIFYCIAPTRVDIICQERGDVVKSCVVAVNK